ncbi:hypothetical protein SAMN04487967_1567 [Natronorubrum sediminis]|uniref:Uncharacterized protein n=1 Tax=Natronorubrum sediminis TaxID=640943 RepID=A0A1H6FWG2_9EURY|nr:hypothetical protein SAMN04487967_1567 [Natronorubrum sediminis]
MNGSVSRISVGRRSTCFTFPSSHRCASYRNRNLSSPLYHIWFKISYIIEPIMNTKLRRISHMATYLPQPSGSLDRLRQTGFYISILLIVASLYVARHVSLLVAGGFVLLATAIAVLSFPFEVFRTTDSTIYLYNRAETPIQFTLKMRAEGDDTTGLGDMYELSPGNRMIVTDQFEPDRRYTVSVTINGRESRTDVTPVKSTEREGSRAAYVAFDTDTVRSGWHHPDGPQFAGRTVVKSPSENTRGTLNHDW